MTAGKAIVARLLPALGLAGGTLSRLLAFALVGVALAACASDKELTIPDEPADKLYNEGLYLLQQKKDFKEAAKKFEEVDRQHPYSDWARKALLMQAYSYYEAREYDDTISAAKRYVAMHPGSADAAYAQYLIGSSYYEVIPDVTRDQQRTEAAMKELEQVIRRYPDTEYAASARKKLDVARDQLAGKEMMIGRFYLNKKDFSGAINRFKLVVTQYQTTRHVEEALMRLTEAYMALGIVQEAQTAAAVLGHNFPDSQWYQNAYQLVQSGGLQPSENKQSWISKMFQPKPPAGEVRIGTPVVR
jgi:outer membrane protein assembly factor BamD